MVSRQESTPVDSSLSVIGAGMKVTGDVETTGVVKIDGTIEGSIRTAKQVVLGRTGAIHGDVHADEAVLGGTVVGSVVTAQRVDSLVSISTGSQPSAFRMCRYGG